MLREIDIPGTCRPNLFLLTDDEEVEVWLTGTANTTGPLNIVVVLQPEQSDSANPVSGPVTATPEARRSHQYKGDDEPPTKRSRQRGRHQASQGHTDS